VPGDIRQVARELSAAGANGSGPSLWPVDGVIVTEIEAIQLLSGARAAPVGAGGIAGAEGSVRLSVWGTRGELELAEAAVEAVLGEPPFLAPAP